MAPPATDPAAPAATAAEVVVVVGTRPEIVKTAPVVRALRRDPVARPYVVHTGQHYDAELSAAFFESLDLAPPDENLGVGSGSQAAQAAAGLRAVAGVLGRREPACVLAQGDTNAVLSTALAASKLPPPFAHVEAGLRSGDRSMPEEVNRVVADHLADLAFAPTADAAANLAAEGLTDGVFRTGNTVVDACRDHAPVAAERSTVLSRLGLSPDGYAVATLHRPRNVDDTDRLRRTLAALADQPLPVVLPAHPRTAAAVEREALAPGGRLRLVDPLDYLDFLRLLDAARAVVTDSGGVQEEAAVLEVPCLTVRPNTERPETVAAGVNALVEPAELGSRLRRLLRDASRRAAMTGVPDLYGDGRAGERVVGHLRRTVLDAG